MKMDQRQFNVHALSRINGVHYIYNHMFYHNSDIEVNLKRRKKTNSGDQVMNMAKKYKGSAKS